MISRGLENSIMSNNQYDIIEACKCIENGMKTKVVMIFLEGKFMILQEVSFWSIYITKIDFDIPTYRLHCIAGSGVSIRLSLILCEQQHVEFSHKGLERWRWEIFSSFLYLSGYFTCYKINRKTRKNILFFSLVLWYIEYVW